jgi:hypothetical protein
MGFFAAAVCSACLHMQAQLHQASLKQGKATHLIYWNDKRNNHRLLISLGGTGSAPQIFQDFDRTASEQGFHVLAIDYPNKVITTICRDLGERGCFERFHRNIALGEQVSAQAHVVPADAILPRVRQAVRHLAKTHPDWREFWKNGDVDWSKVWLAGHSQGSGHAAFLGNRLPVQRVLLLGGPQDSFSNGQVDDWVKPNGGGRYYAFLHAQDFFKSDLQRAVFRALGGKESHLVVVKDPVHDPHNSLLTMTFIEDWRRLLSADPP